MRPLTAFAAGVVVGKTLVDIAGAVANSDTLIGLEVRRKLLGKMSLEHLLRRETEVGEEINRRVRGAPPPPEPRIKMPPAVEKRGI